MFVIAPSRSGLPLMKYLFVPPHETRQCRVGKPLIRWIRFQGRAGGPCALGPFLCWWGKEAFRPATHWRVLCELIILVLNFRVPEGYLIQIPTYVITYRRDQVISQHLNGNYFINVSHLLRSKGSLFPWLKVFVTCTFDLPSPLLTCLGSTGHYHERLQVCMLKYPAYCMYGDSHRHVYPRRRNSGPLQNH